ncbi:MAG: hypothetical protein LBF92_04205, partial [Synergistaceae bacterium]|nr:hypothetical protein [Synergistaceae bacterium]
EGTTVNPATGVITIPGGGAVTLSDGETVIVVPPATTIDSASATMTVTASEGGTVVLPVDFGNGSEGVEVKVPSGSKIDAKTGVITLPDGGTVTFSYTGGAVYESGGRRAGEGVKSYAVPPATTISPETGVMTMTNGGKITLPGGNTVTVAPGTTINPFTGEITPPRDETNNVAENPGSGCDAGTGIFGLLAASGAAVFTRRKFRQEA